MRLPEGIIPIVSGAGARTVGAAGGDLSEGKGQAARIGKPRIEFGVIREILSIFVAVVSRAKPEKE